MTNAYSPSWYSNFSISPQQTDSEIAFITRHLPLPHYMHVVDLCCGIGRHARLLAKLGYHVTAVDRNPFALEEAKRLGDEEGVVYRDLDMRRFSELNGSFEAVINLWQSFGYFYDETNRGILSQINHKLNSSGRLILDIYHRGFFEQHQGRRIIQRNEVDIIERKWMKENRLFVELSSGDSFEWQLFYPDELIQIGKLCGFKCMLACREFDENKTPSANMPRAQYVFEKDYPIT